MKAKLLNRISTCVLALVGWLLILLAPLLLADPALPLNEVDDIRWLLCGLAVLWSALVGGVRGAALCPRWGRAGLYAAALCFLLVMLTVWWLAPALLTPAFCALAVLLLLPASLVGALLGAGRSLYAGRIAAEQPDDPQ